MLTLLSSWHVALAATTDLPVQVEISGIEGPLLDNVKGLLEIYQFHEQPGPSRARLRFLHKAANAQIATALQPFGFYRPQIDSELERTDSVWLARYRVQPGDAIPVTELRVEITGPGQSDPAIADALADSELQEGQPLNQAAYEALKKALQFLASERGYFDARFTDQRIRVHLPSYTASIALIFDTGERYRLGEVQFKQQRDVLADTFLRRYLEIEPGQAYEAADLQQLQGDLSNTQYFSQVQINASPPASGTTIPVDVLLKEKPPRQYTFGVGYGTDTGARVKAGISGRRVNRWGHHYQAEALVSQISYGLAGEYVIPGKDPRTDAYGIRASLEDEHSDNRDYQAFNLGGYYRHREQLWVKTYALDYRVEKFEIDDDDTTSKLLIPSMEWTRTYPAELEKRIYALSGNWLQLRVRGGHDALLSDTRFLQPLVAAKWITSFSNRSRVIARGTLGTTWVDDFDALPTSLRFFTGGDKTVRGYTYNDIGPRNAENTVVGGKHLTELGVEYEYPIADKFGLALFYDWGDAYNDDPDYKAGAGFGLRWQSPIGPVRIDLGHGLDQPPGKDIRLHLTIGPDL